MSATAVASTVETMVASTADTWPVDIMAVVDGMVEETVDGDPVQVMDQDTQALIRVDTSVPLVDLELPKVIIWEVCKLLIRTEFFSNKVCRIRWG